METHYLGQSLRQYGRSTYARWALEPARKAVIFVHGFGGSASATWSGFEESLQDARHGCAGHDIYFYDYESRRRETSWSAAGLRELLKVLLVDPAGLINGELGAASMAARPAAFRYDRITIAAHSLGAVITRRALLDLARERPRIPLDTIRMVFYAPAHMGANIIQLGRALLGLIRVMPVDAVARYAAPVLRDLEEGSQALTVLQADTREELEKEGDAGHLVAAAVLHGEDDFIVVKTNFCRDPCLIPIQGADHIGICKLSPGFDEPLKHLLQHV